MRLLLLLLSLTLVAQAPGTIVVNGSVTATAGTVICTGTPGVVAGTIKAVCTTSGTTVLDSTITPVTIPASGVVISVGVGLDNVTAILTKVGTTINWDVAANGVHKTGSF